MTAAIHIEQLGKQYRIGALRQPYLTLRDTLTRAAQRAGRAWRRGQAADDPTLVWALRDVSLEIERGMTLGVVGGNGAGKSTLLKILSRITEPTTGYGEIRGRVGSLLEVGTGFHPELTGRENVYLNGAILGMRRVEINQRLDEIFAFAEIDRFVDTAVKYYSSGMYLRLAFAVAAHLEPDILLVDEVLAVGDAAFQRRCLGKMDDVAKDGRTVVFVSHNLDAVRRLCSHAVLLERGTIAAEGSSTEVIAHYLSRDRGESMPERWIDLSAAERSGSGAARFVAARYGSGSATVSDHAFTGGPLTFSLVIESDAPRDVASLAVTVYDQFGVKLINADTISQGDVVHLDAGRTTVGLRIEQIYLNPGRYVAGLWLSDLTGHPFDYVESAFQVEVVVAEVGQFGTTPESNGVVPCRFEIVQSV